MKKIFLVIVILLVICIGAATVAMMLQDGGGDAPHTHSFSEEWSYDSYGHWHRATCEHTEEKSEYSEHNYGGAETCTVCGFDADKQVDGTDWSYELSSLLYDAYRAEIEYSKNGQKQIFTLRKGNFIYYTCLDTAETYYTFDENEQVYKYYSVDGNWESESVGKEEYTALDEKSGAITGAIERICERFGSFSYDEADGCYKTDGIASGISGLSDESYTVRFADRLLIGIEIRAALSADLADEGEIVIGIKPSISFDPPPVSTKGLRYVEENGSITVTGVENTNITSVVIPATIGGLPVTKIAACAFKNINLQSVYISDTVTNIGEEAFSCRKSLSYIRLGASVERIGARAFDGMLHTATVIMYDSVKEIGADAFGTSTDNFYTGVGRFYGDINAYAEIRLGNENSAPFKDAVLYLGDSEEPLEHFVLDTAVSVSPYAFSGLHQIREVTLGKSVRSVGTYAFETNALLMNGAPIRLNYGGTLEEFCGIEVGELYMGTAYDLYIDGAAVTKIDFNLLPVDKNQLLENRFAYCCTLREIILPDGLLAVNDGAFKDCIQLSTVHIPDSVIAIGNNAFSQTEITEIALPQGVESVGDYAFSGCKKLARITLGDSLLRLGEWVFDSCDALVQIVVPASVEEIGDRAFSYCNALQKVTLMGAVARVGSELFLESPLIELDQQNGAYYLGNEAEPYLVLYKAVSTSIRSVTLSDECKTIAAYAFAGCTELESVHFNSALENIGVAAFTGCASLETVVTPPSVKYIGAYAFDSCGALSYVLIDSAVESLLEYTFIYCSSLKTLVLGRSFKEIVADAVLSSALEGVCYLGSREELDEVTVLGNLGLYMHIYYYSSEEPAQRPCYYWNYSPDTGLPQLFSLE